MSDIETELIQLPKDKVRVCLDDDKISRMMLNGIIRSPDLNTDQPKSIVIGETLQEAQGLMQTVMNIAARVGEGNVICIFDQMMEYRTVTVLGTEVTTRLRSVDFKGIVLICSSKDGNFAREVYRDAGASGFLSKSIRKGSAIVRSIVTEANTTTHYDKQALQLNAPLLSPRHSSRRAENSSGTNQKPHRHEGVAPCHVHAH